MALIEIRTQLYHFLEFLQGNKDDFIKPTNDMLKNNEDIKLLPTHMFKMLLKDKALFRANDNTKIRFVVKQ